MKREEVAVPAQQPAPDAEREPSRARRPFTPPAVQELGELKEMTQQFGGTL